MSISTFSARSRATSDPARGDVPEKWNGRDHHREVRSRVIVSDCVEHAVVRVPTIEVFPVGQGSKRRRYDCAIDGRSFCGVS